MRRRCAVGALIVGAVALVAVRLVAVGSIWSTSLGASGTSWRPPCRLLGARGFPLFPIFELIFFAHVAVSTVLSIAAALRLPIPSARLALASAMVFRPLGLTGLQIWIDCCWLRLLFGLAIVWHICGTMELAISQLCCFANASRCLRREATRDATRPPDIEHHV